jgi:hypothetical protein
MERCPSQRWVSRWCAHSDYRHRTDFASLTHTLFTRLYAIESKTAEVQPFLTWLLQDYIDPALIQRGFTATSLLALRVFEILLDIFGEREIFYTAERIDCLLACQNSGFEEVRARAGSM